MTWSRIVGWFLLPLGQNSLLRQSFWEPQSSRQWVGNVWSMKIAPSKSACQRSGLPDSTTLLIQNTNHTAVLRFASLVLSSARFSNLILASIWLQVILKEQSCGKLQPHWHACFLFPTSYTRNELHKQVIFVFATLLSGIPSQIREKIIYKPIGMPLIFKLLIELSSKPFE